MLGRRQSVRGEPILIDYALEDALNESSDIEWINKRWVRWLFNLCSLASLVSVSANTSETFQIYPVLKYVTLVCDVVVTLLFTAEMIAKMYMHGIIRGDAPYIKDRWCQYDAFMLFFHWVSIVLHVFELMKIVRSYSLLSLLRAPRPLIVVRLVRLFLIFSLPKSRLKQIFKRSSQQINNVTLFFLFFLSLYGLLGVQLFGDLRSHCVLNTTLPSNNSDYGDPADTVIIQDISPLAVPDTFCSKPNHEGYQCPEGMVCKKVVLYSNVSGFTGFGDFGW